MQTKPRKNRKSTKKREKQEKYCVSIIGGSLSSSPLRCTKPMVLSLKMAFVLARMPSPLLMVVNERKPIFGLPQKLAIPIAKERQDRYGVIAKATGESSESSIVKSIQNVWDKSEDRVALIGLGFAGIVAFWASANLVTAIDKLPLIPSVFELIGLLFATWFAYRYLLFKPDRQELSQQVSKSISDILGK